MKITGILIENYKSIKKMEIPIFDDYGGSNTVFLLGLNESGKSSVLDAIHQLETRFGDGQYYVLCHKSCQKQGGEIRVTARAQLTDEEYLRCVDLLKEKLPILGDDVKKVAGVEIVKSVALSKEGAGESLQTRVHFDKNFVFGKYKHIEGVIALADSGAESDSAEESEDTESSIMDIDQMEQIVVDNIRELVNFPTVLSWKSSPEHLLMREINLREFRDNQNLSIPLKNIFSLNGEKTVSDVQETIDWALGSDENRAELEENLSHHATKHINAVWEEHPVNIKVKIHGESIGVLVEDKDAVRTFLNVEQRSDGFKQFISLLLSISAQHKGEILKNDILLLDEPEAHLHPSGIRYMRDEIFEMGRSNQIFVATHSPVMVDVDAPERHWIVKKEKLETRLQFVGADASMKDEEVMRMAFGIDVMKEILPENLLLVEGKTDKTLLEFFLHELSKEKCEYIDVTIMSSGGSKISVLANMLDSHDINAVILLDADGEGKRTQEKIIENRSFFNENNVVTLGDLIDDLPKDATIEDLIPENCVEKSLKDNSMAYNSHVARDGVPVLIQIVSDNPRLKGPANKKYRDKIKLEMVEQVIRDYSLDNKGKYARLFELAEKLLEVVRKTRRH